MEVDLVENQIKRVVHYNFVIGGINAVWVVVASSILLNIVTDVLGLTEVNLVIGTKHIH